MSPPPSAISAAVARAMTGEFGNGACIAAARVTIEVCRYFAIPARPQPVTVAAFTPMAWELRGLLVDRPAEDWPPGAWTVGVAGGPSAPGRWNGHLVTLTGLPGDDPAWDGPTGDGAADLAALRVSWLIDPTLSQLSRPTRGLRVGPAAFPLADGLPEDPGTVLAITLRDGIVIMYGKLDDGAWQDSPNWNRRRGYIMRTAGAAIRELRGL